MSFAYLPKNKQKIKRWVDELIAEVKVEDKQKTFLKKILHQRLWVSPMLNGNDVFIAFRAACRKLAKHRSITRLNLGPALLAALKEWQKVPLPRNVDLAKQNSRDQG